MAKRFTYCSHDSVPKSFNPGVLLHKHVCRWCGHELTQQEVADRAGLNDTPATPAEIKVWDYEGDDDNAEL